MTESVDMENYFTKEELSKMLADMNKDSKSRIDALIKSTDENHAELKKTLAENQEELVRIEDMTSSC